MNDDKFKTGGVCAGVVANNNDCLLPGEVWISSASIDTRVEQVVGKEWAIAPENLDFGKYVCVSGWRILVYCEVIHVIDSFKVVKIYHRPIKREDMPIVEIQS